LRFLYVSYAEHLFQRFSQPVGNGTLVNADVSDDPFKKIFLRLSRVRQCQQLLLHLPEEEDVCRSQIQQIGGVFEQLDLVGDHGLLNDVGA
jgi:hypothetical protein